MNQADSSMESTKQSTGLSDIFHSNPMNFKGKMFEDESEVFVRDIKIDLSTVIESYQKSIRKNQARNLQ